MSSLSFMNFPIKPLNFSTFLQQDLWDHDNYVYDFPL